MGQEQSAQNGSNRKASEGGSGTTKYEIDARLLDKFMPLPSSFSFSLQKILNEAMQFQEEVTSHPLERFMIHCLDERFNRYNLINAEAIDSQKSILEILGMFLQILQVSFHSPAGIDMTKFQTKEWKEFSQKSLFLKLLTKLQKQYHIESKLRSFRNVALKSKRSELSQASNRTNISQTIRKSHREYEYNSQINENLLIRLFFHYYVVIMKSYLNSVKEKERLLAFHEKTGKNLCLIILYNYLNLEQLFELTYLITYVQKHQFTLAHRKLLEIEHKYHPICLKNYYSVTCDRKYHQKLQITTRLYLDQLYMNSVKEAEDPDIGLNDDALLPVRVFPINRVKEKHRN